MGIIRLEGMEFSAYHGVMDEERRIGNRFQVDLVLETDFEEAAQTDKLNDTVDYEAIYRIVSSRMQTPARLLEFLAREIATEVKGRFPAIRWIEVTVSKFNPPVGGICKQASVVYRA